MDNLTERIAWAITTIKDDKDLDKGIKDIDLAKILGTNKDTLAAYRNCKGLLKGEVIEKIVSYYHFSPTWLFQGQGEPFPRARDKYPEVCGPEEEPIVSSIPQATARSGAPVVDPQAFQIDLGEDVRLAIEVLSSGTHYASSLHMNIRSFAAAVTDNKRLTVLEETQRQLEVKINSMESRMEEMIVQNKALLAEVNRLKATYEDPDGGNGSLTNTSGND